MTALPTGNIRTRRAGRPSRRWTGIVALVPLLALGASCDVEPAPPLPLHVVTVLTDGPDAIPGDGTCSTAAGDCTLRAAVEEAGAGAGARIHVPGGQHEFDGPLTVDATVHLVGPGILFDATVHVATDGVLVLDEIGLHGSVVHVDGVVVLRRSVAAGAEAGRDPLVVNPGGTALIQRSWLVNMEGAAIRNDGTVVVESSTIGLAIPPGTTYGAPAGQLVTGTGGHTQLTSTWFGNYNSPNCTGKAPVSNGYNADPDDSCGLDQPTDRHDAPYVGIYSVESGPIPPAGSSLIDVIPFGSGGCTDLVGTDRFGVALPQDGDADGTAACDIGSAERPEP